MTFADVLGKTEKMMLEQHTVYVKELGGNIPYYDLNLEDFADIYQKDQKPADLSAKAFYKAWSKADPTVKLEDVKTKIPLRISLKVINDIVPGLLTTTPLGISPARQSAEQPSS